MIHGRRDVRAFSAARAPGVRALGGNPDAQVNAAWDAWFLKQLVAADLDPVTGLGDVRLQEQAGSGGREIRTGTPASSPPAARWCGRATSQYRNGSPAWASARRSRWRDAHCPSLALAGVHHRHLLTQNSLGVASGAA